MAESVNNFTGFSKLSYEERLQKLVQDDYLSAAEAEYLKSGSLKDFSLAENFIENVIGWFQVPLGVATHFKIDGVDRLIPMAVEETSIIAAASKTAKWIRECGEITTSLRGHDIIGQIQFAKVKNKANFEKIIFENKKHLIQELNLTVAASFTARGGGVSDLQVRFIERPDQAQMAVVHVLMNPVDAMGANIVNQVCEYLKKPLFTLTGEEATMCILSNLVDTKLTHARVVLKVDEKLGLKIQEGSLFAQLDPYRAATNNKGVLNGIDPILVATGNDWRAVEAGLHAYACREGQYRSITRWSYSDGHLTGELTAPLVVGTVGGVTHLHPTAKLCLRLLRVQKAEDLSRILAAVGLVQNLGALRALTTVGIIEGHMRLHIKNLVLGTDANEHEVPVLIDRLESLLSSQKRISMNHAVQVLGEMRSAHATK